MKLNEIDLGTAYQAHGSLGRWEATWMQCCPRGCIVLTLAPVVHRWAWNLKAISSAFSKNTGAKLICGMRGRITAIKFRGQELENFWEQEGSTLTEVELRTNWIEPNFCSIRIRFVTCELFEKQICKKNYKEFDLIRSLYKSPIFSNTSRFRNLKHFEEWNFAYWVSFTSYLTI